MASTDQNTPAAPSIRVFNSKQIMPKAPLALGRSHSSWFLCFARPWGQSSIRIHECINHIDHNQAATSPAPTADGHFRFVFTGLSFGVSVEDLLAMRDAEGCAPIRLTGDKVGSSPVVEVLIPPAEVMYTCAHCGKWEALGTPRFQRCSGCHSRFYCSKTCQKQDWTAALHKGDCALLKEGREHDVECRRQLHDNHWWLNSKVAEADGPLPQRIYSDALEEGDWDFVNYGVRNPPRKAPAHVAAFHDPTLIARAQMRRISSTMQAMRRDMGV